MSFLAQLRDKEHQYQMLSVKTMASHKACESMKPELDLFSEVPLQTSIDHGQWIEY